MLWHDRYIRKDEILASRNRRGRAAAGPARSGWRRPSGGSASMGTAKRSRTRCHLDGPTTGSASRPAIARSRLAIPAGQSDIVAGMKIIFSRKGFDSASGAAPSPIYEGRPISIPIPYAVRSETTYGDLGLGAVVEWLTKGRLTRTSFCHQDPMFEGRRCAFGQVEASQGHLENNGVGVGDVFLFFGLFANVNGSDPHHRIFGYLKVEEVMKLGSAPPPSSQPSGFSRRHPHTLPGWPRNNTIYVGPGRTASSDTRDLRLSVSGGPVSRWKVPSWLRKAGLTYHGNPERWGDDNTLEIVGRGQEFVTDVAGCPTAAAWLGDALSMISGTMPVAGSAT